VRRNGAEERDSVSTGIRQTAWLLWVGLERRLPTSQPAPRKTGETEPAGRGSGFAVLLRRPFLAPGTLVRLLIAFSCFIIRFH